jgi:hypothetical protein
MFVATHRRKSATSTNSTAMERAAAVARPGASSMSVATIRFATEAKLGNKTPEPVP